MPESDPENYQTPCDAPKTDDDADLCQQWRMAEAAEETADWAFGQIIATGVEAVLLAFAIGVAFWAGSWARRAAIAGQKMVDQARRATKAAEESLLHTKEAFANERRPWISVDAAAHDGISFEKDRASLFIDFLPKNHGKSPATNVWIEADAHEIAISGKALEEQLDRLKEASLKRTRTFGATVFPDKTTTMCRKLTIERKNLSVGAIMPIFYGAVFYQSPADEEPRYTEFAYVILIMNEDGGPLTQWPEGHHTIDHVQIEELPFRPRVT
ncbi:MAG: hypothetical protein ACU0B1_00345 [Thermohalobaculum sp.]